ncbi:MAG: M14 family metallopeptidase [Candidatus Alcyoniella australis]|nr:M14 family metallopeptidase [Candidatus Alcyoniella australis]
MRAAAILTILAAALLLPVIPAQAFDDNALLIEIPAMDKYERSAIADLGLDIVQVLDESVLVLGRDYDLALLQDLGYTVFAQPLPQLDVAVDPAYRYFDGMVAVLNTLADAHPDVMLLSSIGQSWESRELWTIKLSDNPDQDESASEPGLSFVGQHHAREHISLEVPLGFLEYMGDTYDYLYSTTNLVQTHEIWVTPMLNPDGVVYDISGGSYHYWRKNRRDNEGSYEGVDLNRNYGYMWGGSGSSGTMSSDTYRGPSAFSEPESAAYRDLIVDNPSIEIIVSFHNFSKLVIWPWGYTYSAMPEPDHTNHVTLGTQYASYTGYTPQQSSDLYITSGDTCDWAYGDQGRICFTVELDPVQFGGDFYLPGSQIPEVQAKNLNGMLYLIWQSDDPGKSGDLPYGMQGVARSWSEYNAGMIR